MTSVTQFTHHLLRLDPQRSSARLTLFNYLKHVVEPSEPFSPLTIENFYARVLNYEHWQNSCQGLAEAVREDLFSFVKQARLNEEDWKKIRHADEIQVLSLKHARDLEEIVRASESARRKSGEKFKLLNISETEIASLFLSQWGTLEVKVFAPRAVVQGAKLSPLAPVSHLHYTSSMELIPHVRQVLQGSLATTMSFHHDEEGLHGVITRGHTFQKFETFLRARTNDNHDLFCSLKRLERCFINPQSDPYYQEIVGALERAARAVSAGADPRAAEKVLQKGTLALRSAFPNDRLLQLLVTHLDYGIRQARTQSSSKGHPAE